VSKGHKPHVLAHKWFYEFGTRHNMSIKAGRKLRDMRMVCRIAGVRSTEQSEESVLDESRKQRRIARVQKGKTKEEKSMFLEIKGIHRSFGAGENRVEVLKGIDVEMERGELCVLLGPSGSGKSTLLNIIGGIDSADSGYISIAGEKTADMSEKALTAYRRKHLGYIFQQYNLIPNLTVRENIEVGAYLSEKPLNTDEILEVLGLTQHQHKMPNQLSGGQQQRTAIGRAVIKNPDILLCDEPTGALDYNTSKDILKLISDVNEKYGCTVLMVTHNDAIQNMADRVIKLHDGTIRSNIVNADKTDAALLEW